MGLATAAVAVALAVLGAAAEPAWTQVESGQVEVWTRKLPGDNVAEVRARMAMRASPADVRAVLEDSDRARKQPHVAEYRTLKHPAPNVWVQYGRVTFPLVDDRDYFVESTIESDLAPDGSGHFRVSWKPWGLDLPSRFHVVRVKRSEGHWDVQPLPGGRSQVEFEIICDPGGSIPGWLVDKLNRGVVPDMLRGVERDAMAHAQQRH